MSTADGINIAIQRRMLSVGVRNSARSVPLLTVAVVFLAWLAWQAQAPLTAGLMLVLGLPASLWRWGLHRQFRDETDVSPARIAAVVQATGRQRRAGGPDVGCATFLIYPTLTGTMATVYVVIVCGSIATAAFFLSIVGRSFMVLVGAAAGLA